MRNTVRCHQIKYILNAHSGKGNRT